MGRLPMYGTLMIGAEKRRVKLVEVTVIYAPDERAGKDWDGHRHSANSWSGKFLVGEPITGNGCAKHFNPLAYWNIAFPGLPPEGDEFTVDMANARSYSFTNLDTGGMSFSGPAG